VKTVEIIHLRQTGEDLQALLGLIRRTIDLENEPMDVRIYRHATLETDLAIHLHHENSAGADRASRLGARLAAAVRDHGMVEHSRWRTADPARREP
jgi:hypothetical protein